MPDGDLVASGDFDSVGSWLTWPAEEPADDGALLHGGTSRRSLAARSGTLRIGKASSGDQRQRGDRNHKTITHGFFPHVFALPAPTTK